MKFNTTPGCQQLLYTYHNTLITHPFAMVESLSTQLLGTFHLSPIGELSSFSCTSKRAEENS